MPAWPSSLPQSPLIDGFEVAEDSGFIRTTIDAGPVKQRKRYSSRVITFSADIICTQAQVTELEDFYDLDLQSGSLTFTWVFPPTGQTVNMRFVEPLSYRPITGTKFIVAMKLEILPDES